MHVMISYFLLNCLISSTTTPRCSSYSGAVIAPISNKECSSLRCSKYLLQRATTLLGESVLLAVVVVVLCLITSLIELARPENASVSCVELDRRDFPSPNSGELGGSSMLSWVCAKIDSAQNVYCIALNFEPCFTCSDPRSSLCRIFLSSAIDTFFSFLSLWKLCL